MRLVSADGAALRPASRAAGQPHGEQPALPLMSVVVPTCGRPALLRRCLTALLAQDLAPEAFEVIVVDDGQGDATRQLVAELAQRSRLPLRYMSPREHWGPAFARNAGWRFARAPIIAFTDDDTVPRSDWLMEGWRALAAHPDWVAAAGRVVVPPLRPGQPPTDHERMTRGLERADFVTANAFVRRGALMRINGFDDRFRRAWREDSDLHFRLLTLAGPVGRAPRAAVLHPVRPEPWGVSLRQQRNAFFEALLYKKHPVLYRQMILPTVPWDFYAIVLMTVAALPLALLATPGPMLAALGTAAALVLRFAWRRLRGADRSWRHVGEMLATSAAIPFLSVYWRLRGAWRFRVWFL